MVICGHCKAQIADDGDLFFYVKSERDVHLSVKPEAQGKVVAASLLVHIIQVCVYDVV